MKVLFIGGSHHKQIMEIPDYMQDWRFLKVRDLDYPAKHACVPLCENIEEYRAFRWFDRFAIFKLVA